MQIQCIIFVKIHFITCITLNYCLTETLPLGNCRVTSFKDFFLSLVPRFQIPTRKQLSKKLLAGKFQMIQYLLKTDLVLLTVLKYLEFAILYDYISRE